MIENLKKREKSQEEKDLIVKNIESNYKMDYDREIERPEVILSFWNEKNQQYYFMGTMGGLTVISGAPKSRKSFFMSMILGTLASRSPIYQPINTELKGINNKIVYIDTEQAEWHLQRTIKTIKRDAPLTYDNVTVISAVKMENHKELVDYIEMKAQDPEVSVIAIDNIGDIIDNINDVAESKKVVKLLLRLASENNVHIIITLHRNKTSDVLGGHAGSILLQKAETVFDIKFLNDTTSMVRLDRSRNMGFNPFTFTIDEDVNITTAYDTEEYEK